jgi:SAM-dependent methyltransferase
MASDWRVVDEPLARWSCDTCGLAFRQQSHGTDGFFRSESYSLYAHPPGEAREFARQAQYASWISSVVTTPPSQVLDVGCGNGSFLLALKSTWPGARLLGCDPSPASVAHGAANGLRVWQGTAADVPATAVSDAVVSINVIEHTPEPPVFLRALARATASNGMLVVVCPDGSRPNIELLIADHLFSFLPEHLRLFCEREGLTVEFAGRAPEALGPFQMIAARRSATHRPIPMAHRSFALASLQSARTRFMQAWAGLDDHLVARLPDSVVCFGAGEAAGLLRAYAPHTWSRIRACTVDGDARGHFGTLPLVSLDTVEATETVLVAVRGEDQQRVAERLRARFSRVETWDDLIQGTEYDQ